MVGSRPMKDLFLHGVQGFDPLQLVGIGPFCLSQVRVCHLYPEEPYCAMKVDAHLPSERWLLSRSLTRDAAAAQHHFQRRLKLTAEGLQLDETATLREAGLQDGDVVLAVAQLGKLAATDRAFAWHGHGGEVVTWGPPVFGGNSSQVREQLKNVQHMQATACSLAVTLNSGSVVTWGHAEYGGNSSQVQGQLRNVEHSGIWSCFDLGRSRGRKRQLPGSRAVEERPAHPSKYVCFCRHS